ncbi:MAG TPA: tyrosine-type recombinase/integrase [Candidatus Acidoferrum sp.]|jgi:integrase/recombinase XerD|nr:tyrosine-type recombinase/integrase [Candidatus Acidoferrum sp.]
MPATKLRLAKSPKSESPLERAMGDYLSAVRARGGSPRTEQYYSAILWRVLLPWAASEGISKPEQLDQPSVDRLNAQLLGETSEATGKPLSRASVASYLRGVRQFVRWAQGEGLIADKVRVQQVKVPRKVLVTLDRADIAAMEAAAPTERDKVIIRVLGDCGLRLAELVGLKADSLIEQGRDRFLKVEGKGSRERLVPIRPAVYLRLKRLAEKGRPVDVMTSRIFISLRRRASGGYEALDARAVQQMLKTTAERAGITKRVNPHSFRHSMITNALRARANPIVVAQVAGHSDLSMIFATYSHLVASDDYREMMRILAPED